MCLCHVSACFESSTSLCFLPQVCWPLTSWASLWWGQISVVSARSRRRSCVCAGRSWELSTPSHATTTPSTCGSGDDHKAQKLFCPSVLYRNVCNACLCFLFSPRTPRRSALWLGQRWSRLCCCDTLSSPSSTHSSITHMFTDTLSHGRSCSSTYQNLLIRMKTWMYVPCCDI